MDQLTNNDSDRVRKNGKTQIALSPPQTIVLYVLLCYDLLYFLLRKTTVNNIAVSR